MGRSIPKAERVSLPVVSFAFYWTWGYIAFFTPALVAPGDDLLRLTPFYFWSLTSFLATLTLSIALARRTARLLGARRVVWALGAILCAATLAASALLANPVGCAVTGALTGAASSLLVLAWGLRCAAQKPLALSWGPASWGRGLPRASR